jgi:hypothetical protein
MNKLTAKRPRISARQFAVQYAVARGRQLSELAEYRVIVPCDCDYEGCEGWGMVPRDVLLPYDERLEIADA